MEPKHNPASAVPRTIPWDWYPGTIPENVRIDPTAYVETSFSFHLYRSRAPVGVEIGLGASTYLGTMFDVGPRGTVKLGCYALVHGARIICDARVEIGDFTLVSWNVVIMDSYRLPRDPIARRRELERTALRRPGYVGPDIGGTHGLPIPAAVEPQPVHIGRNVWIGFDACVLPGVSIGDGSVVGAKSVVTEDVPPYTVVAGNPARVIRRLQPQELDAKSIEMMSLELRSAGAREAAEGIDHGR